jgi:hypothetical protein
MVFFLIIKNVFLMPKILVLCEQNKIRTIYTFLYTWIIQDEVELVLLVEVVIVVGIEVVLSLCVLCY